MSEERPRAYDLFYQEIPSTDYFSDFETDIADYTDTEQQPSLSESQVSQLAEDNLRSLDPSSSLELPDDYGEVSGFNHPLS